GPIDPLLSCPRKRKRPATWVVAGLVDPGTSLRVCYGSPPARATTVAGRPDRRDPSRLFSAARFIREGISSPLYAAAVATVKVGGYGVLSRFRVTNCRSPSPFQGEGRGEGRWQDRCVQEFVAWRSPLTLALSPQGRGKYVEQSETLPATACGRG